MYDIFTYIWLIFMGFHAGKYTRPMDPTWDTINHKLYLVP